MSEDAYMKEVTGETRRIARRGHGKARHGEASVQDCNRAVLLVETPDGDHHEDYIAE